MRVGRDLVEQLRRHLIRPLSVRIANAIARAVVQGVNDGTKLQSVQLGVLDGETIDDGERFQQYGFTSVPIAGAEAVVLFPNGDRGHPLVVAVDDRRYRPNGWEPGEVGVYNFAGAVVKLTKDGNVIISAAPGCTVTVDDGSGLAEPLITKTQFDTHVHPTAVGPSAVPSNAAISGTTVLKAK